MAGTRPEAAEGLIQRRKDRARVAAQFGAEVLGAIVDAGLFQEIDAAVDLVHVVTGAHHVERELRRRRLAGGSSVAHGGDGGFLAWAERPDRSSKRVGAADRIVRLAGAAA